MKTKINIKVLSSQENKDRRENQVNRSTLGASVQRDENCLTVSIDIECESEDTLSVFQSQIPFLTSVLKRNSLRRPSSEGTLSNARYQY
ncbi:hypothetical protein [Limibacterium fermenti]|uniref:hypothetical protein n=1 Tax=Limibacterium fermenti TaxID=3229863 RepID=UPI003A62FD1B